MHEVSGEVMAELAQTITPQGLLGVCRFVDVPLESVLTAAPRLVAVLAKRARSRQRRAPSCGPPTPPGADGVIFAAASVDPYNSKCVRSSAGSLFHLPVTVGAPLAAGDRRAAGGRPAGARRRRQRRAVPGFTRRPRPDPADGLAVWQRGVGPAALICSTLADAVVAVPIYGQAESLNLAAAAAVCLYASARQPARESPLIPVANGRLIRTCG